MSVQELQTKYNKIRDSSNGSTTNYKERNKQLRAIEEQIAAQLPLKIGDKFYTSWGYDQTNIDMLVVVEISPSRKTCLCRMISKTVDTGNESRTYNLVSPGERMGPTAFRMKVSSFSSKIVLRGSYPFCVHYWAACKLSDVHRKDGVFKCPKMVDSEEQYFRWDNMKKESVCNHSIKCEHYESRLEASYREGASFYPYDHPVYETDPMYGH